MLDLAVLDIAERLYNRGKNALINVKANISTGMLTYIPGPWKDASTVVVTGKNENAGTYTPYVFDISTLAFTSIGTVAWDVLNCIAQEADGTIWAINRADADLYKLNSNNTWTNKLAGTVVGSLCFNSAGSLFAYMDSNYYKLQAGQVIVEAPSGIHASAWTQPNAAIAPRERILTPDTFLVSSLAGNTLQRYIWPNLPIMPTAAMGYKQAAGTFYDLGAMTGAEVIPNKTTDAKAIVIYGTTKLLIYYSTPDFVRCSTTTNVYTYDPATDELVPVLKDFALPASRSTASAASWSLNIFAARLNGANLELYARVPLNLRNTAASDTYVIAHIVIPNI